MIKGYRLVLTTPFISLRSQLVKGYYTS
jgi:hypothetical protein